jgi:hypothetical protein
MVHFQKERSRSDREPGETPFNIDDPQWQAMIVAQSYLACRQALAGLGAR